MPCCFSFVFHHHVLFFLYFKIVLTVISPFFLNAWSGSDSDSSTLCLFKKCRKFFFYFWLHTSHHPWLSLIFSLTFLHTSFCFPLFKLPLDIFVTTCHQHQHFVDLFCPHLLLWSAGVMSQEKASFPFLSFFFHLALSHDKAGRAKCRRHGVKQFHLPACGAREDELCYVFCFCNRIFDSMHVTSVLKCILIGMYDQVSLCTNVYNPAAKCAIS